MNNEISWDSYEFAIRNEAAAIAKAKTLNESREKLQLELLETEELLSEVEQYRDWLKVLHRRVIKENDNFRTNRLEYLSASITDAIASVFPDKSLKADVSCDFKRKNCVDMRLIDQDAHVIKPSIGSGKLMQYLISFASVCKIVESLQCNSLFIDEAFGVASENNLSIVGDIINSKVQNGMQIVLVSQNPTLYTDVPRREIHLKYNQEKLCAELEKIVDVCQEVCNGCSD